MVNLSRWNELKASGTPIVAITAYDCQMSGIVDEAGVDLILVGDSLGMVVLGHDSTIPVTVDDIEHHTKAVARGNPNTVIVGDMPFLSYGVDLKDTVQNAHRLILAGAHAVKLEGGRKISQHIGTLIDNGIPVMAHLGMQPQSVLKMGGYRLAGQDKDEAATILEDAIELDRLGVCAIVLECVPEALAEEITTKTKAPTIGIGAGRKTSGQILVLNDMLGLTRFSGGAPRFVHCFSDLHSEVFRAVRSYCQSVRSRQYPLAKHTYRPIQQEETSPKAKVPVVKTIDELRQTGIYLDGSKTVGFVPTMGALHEGHLSLIKRAKSECDFVVTSIFVNPTQFGPKEDFARYPRPLERDLELAGEAGCDIAFCPEREYIYPPGESTRVHLPGSLTDSLCGSTRPGHFEGVATVVMKLFNIVKPHKAYFGLKDYQQFLVIKKMVSELFMDLEVVGCPTVREEDGVAMSSRNSMLEPEHRRFAPALQRALKNAEHAIHGGERCREIVEQIMIKTLQEVPGITVDYAVAADAETLAQPRVLSERTALAVAAKFGAVRLIDNLVLDLRGNIS